MDRGGQAAQMTQRTLCACSESVLCLLSHDRRVNDFLRSDSQVGKRRESPIELLKPRDTGKVDLWQGHGRDQYLFGL